MAARAAAIATAASAASALLLPTSAGRVATLRHLVSDPLSLDDSFDVPGVLWLEHLNLLVGRRELAVAFYVDFLGCVAEPGSSFHLNLGSQQFHLAEAAEDKVNRLTGAVGLAVPSLDAIRGRSERAQAALAGTRFDFADHGDALAVVCPWGNSFVCHDATRSVPSSELPKMERAHLGFDESFAVRGRPGIRYVEFRVRAGTVGRVGRFYEEMFGCRVHLVDRSAVVAVGPSVHLVFSEDEPLTDDDEAAQAGSGVGDGLHVCVYIADFKAAFERLQRRGLTWTNPRFVHLDRCDTWDEAAASRQFRIRHVVDLETGEKLLELEHEVRAQRHFQFFKQVHYPDGSA